jgi:hypothetical protein
MAVAYCAYTYKPTPEQSHVAINEFVVLKNRYDNNKNNNNNNSVALVRERNIPTERQPLFGEVSANFYG